MPGRYIREGLVSSEALMRAGELAECLFVRLLLKIDDFACYDGRVSVICRTCWPAADDETTRPAPDPADVEHRLERLARESLIVRYVVDGKPFIYIPKFQQRTRAIKRKWPAPPEDLSTGSQPHDEHVSDKSQSRAWQASDGRQSSASGVRSSGISKSTTVSRNDSASPQAVDKSKAVEKPLTPKPPANASSTAASTPPRDPNLAPIPEAVRKAITASAKGTKRPLHWWDTPAGVAAKGREQDMVRTAGEEPVVFKCRVIARLGIGPWSEDLTAVERMLVERFSAKAPEGLVKREAAG